MPQLTSTEKDSVSQCFRIFYLSRWVGVCNAYFCALQQFYNPPLPRKGLLEVIAPEGRYDSSDCDIENC